MIRMWRMKLKNKQKELLLFFKNIFQCDHFFLISNYDNYVGDGADTENNKVYWGKNTNARFLFPVCHKIFIKD